MKVGDSDHVRLVARETAGRCHRLLSLFPEWRGRLGEVAARFPEWRGLVEAWGELEGAGR